MHLEIDRIRAKRLTTPWPQFLQLLQITGLRGWNGQTIRFEFPVCAIAGENGSGKSTVLKAAAAAYAHPGGTAKSFAPGKFFPDTPWEEIPHASLTYQVVQGDRTTNHSINKPAERWRFPANRPQRNVIFQDISRTLPLESTIGYAYIANRNAREVSASQLDPEITRYYSSIMGREYGDARFALSDVDENRMVGVVRQDNLQFSQFHQGAGESSSLELLSLLQNVPDYALILIDEVEASLHPRSQRRMMHFLLYLARTKMLQIVVSTHSPYILEELPPDGRILLERGSNGISVLYGVTVDFAINRMDDIRKPELFVFVEDKESKTLVETILRKKDAAKLCRMEIIHIGAANMVSAISVVASKERFPVPAVGILDADQEAAQNCLKLPGTAAPENQVINDIRQNDVALNKLAVRLGIALQDLQRVVTNVITIPDHHQWLAQISTEISQSKDYLWESMSQIWIDECVAEDQIQTLCAAICEKLPHD